MKPKSKATWTWIWPWLTALTLWAFLFYPRLPGFMQGGDTPEIVTSGRLLTVAHPPGYPLMTILLHLWDHFFSIESTYWASGLLVSLFSLGTLGLLMSAGRKQPLIALTCGLALATSRVFWKFSELPDVFALHWFLMSAALFVFLEETIRSEVRRLWILSFIFGLSFAHHHTTMFLAPLWIYQLKIVRDPRPILQSMGVGALTSLIFYLLIFTFDTSNLRSWGFIENFSDLLRHFSREDYGTFQLASGNMGLEFWHLLGAVLKMIAFDLLAPCLLLLITLYLLRKKAKSNFWKQIDSRAWSIFICLGLYLCIFLSLSNVKIQGAGSEVFDRFTVMLLILFLFLVLHVAKKLPDLLPLKERRFQYGGLTLVLMGFFVGFTRYGQVSDYSNRRIVQEYLENFLNQQPKDKNKKTVIAATSDTTLFGLYYMTGVLKLRPDLIVVNPSNFHKVWAQRLYHKYLPEAQLAVERLEGQDFNYTFMDFMSDNLHNYNFLVENDFNDPRFHYEYQSVGRFVSAGGGVSFADEKSFQLKKTQDWSDVYVPDYARWDQDLKIYSKYSYYYLAKGLEYFSKKKLKEAAFEFDRGTEKVPYCLPCLANKCFVLSSATGSEHKACFALLNQMTEKYANYYSGQPFTGVRPITSAQPPIQREKTH